MTKNICSNCKKEVKKFKQLKKVKGRFLCKKCYSENRKNRREKMIKEEGIKKELNRLRMESIPIEKRREYMRNWYRRKHNIPLDAPIIKGSKADKDRKRIKSYSYLTYEEKNNLIKILMNNGLEQEEAEKRVKNLIKEEQKIKKKINKNI